MLVLYRAVRKGVGSLLGILLGTEIESSFMLLKGQLFIEQIILHIPMGKFCT